MNLFLPIQKLMDDPKITEIVINSFDSIYFEKDGLLIEHKEKFRSDQDYRNLLEYIASSVGSYFNREKPFLEAQILNRRFTIVSEPIAESSPLLSIRQQALLDYSLEHLKQKGLLTSMQQRFLVEILNKRKNFLVVGNTGCGKTTLIKALLNEIPKEQRCIILEDTPEIRSSNGSSCRLLTVNDSNALLPNYDLHDLLKRSLRLRPDRLIVGEVRGAESKDLLLALSTGHSGSFASLHAGSAQEALLRLEMLVQMGASSWSLKSIRQLIFLSIHYIIVLEKSAQKRSLKGIYEIHSLEENGFTLMPCDSHQNIY